MTSVVCCADAFSAGKSRRNREKKLSPNSPTQSRLCSQGRLVEFQTPRQQSVARRTMFPRQVSRISNAKAKSVARRVMFPRQVSQISNADAAVRYEAGETRARKRIRRFLQVDFSRLPSDFHICGQGHLRQAA